MRTFTSRAIATAAAAAIALTTFGLQPAAAGHRHGGDAAALAAFVAMFGTMAAIIAAEQRRERASYVYHPSYTYGPVHHGPVRHPRGPWPYHRHW
jgi:hypothetical protein